MNPKDDLFRLIHSMKPAEKRYFKTQGGETSNYIQLFDVINKMEKYDESLVKAHFEGQKIATNLPSEKHYLMQSLLASLRAYHTQKHPEAQVQNLLMDAKLLHDRNLYELSAARLKKASRLAQKNGLLALLLDINLMERTLAKRSHQGLTELMDQLVREKDEAMDKLDNYLYFKDLNDKLFCSTRGRFRVRGEEKRRQIKALFPDGHPQNLPPATTFEAKRLRHFSAFQYHLLLAEDQKGLAQYQELVRLWEENPEHIQADKKGYKLALSNYLNICHMVRAYSEFPDALAKLKSYPARSHKEKSEEFQNVVFLEFLYCINHALFIQAQSLVRNVIDEGLRIYKAQITPARHMAFCHSVSMLYIALEKFQEARKWLHRMDERPSEHRIDLMRYRRLVGVLVEYELEARAGEMPVDMFKRFLQGQSRSTERWLEQQGGVMEYEKETLAAAVRLVGKEGDAKKKVFEDLATKLRNVSEEERKQFGGRIQELSLWADARRDGKRLEDVFRKMIQDAGT